MNPQLSDKLKTLPRSPGVYFHKSISGEIIYVGKAAILKNRVRQYFQSQRQLDVKTKALIGEIHDVDWLETDSEIDALFLESEMVKRYMPRYNILLRDDKSQLFVRIDMQNDFPYVSFTRNPSDDMADYFGPFYNSQAIKKALRYLRRIFPYYIKPIQPGKRPELDSHLGLAPTPDTLSREYKANLRQLIYYIKGGRKAILNELEKDMKQAAQQHNFEQAAKIRNRIQNVRELQRRIMFGDKEFLDISKDTALHELKELLQLPYELQRIEGYDISHMGGTNVVASMVVFSNGVSDRAQYRKFKTKIEHNNDFYNMKETLFRRLSDKNLKAWGRPNLIIIDGGKGQLDAALAAQTERDTTIPMIGLAKKQEQIVFKKTSGICVDESTLSKLHASLHETDEYILINLPLQSHIIKLLQRIRDESHRFAVSYHTVLKRQKQTASMLEDIPGIGPATRRKLIKTLGSLKSIRACSQAELEQVVGAKKATVLRKYL